MTHDVTDTITQAELIGLYWAGRLGHYAIVYRVVRNQLGGGFGDQHKYPYAWSVMVHVDGRLTRLISARGAIREWTSLDRLECWLRGQGFRHWWVQNELEPVDYASAYEPEL